MRCSMYRVISGLEEARLIYLGVASGMHLGDRQAFFLDIGGGSTEISVGGQQQYQMLESFRSGAIRLTNLFFSRNLAGPVRSDQYKVVQQYVKNAIIHTVQKIKKQKIDLAVGSSGSIMNLADIAQKALHPAGTSPSGVLTYRDLKKVIDLLCALPLEDRRKVPGINPERADIIIAGAVILETFMKELALRIRNHDQPGAPGRPSRGLSFTDGGFPPVRDAFSPGDERAPAGPVLRDQRGARTDRDPVGA